MSNSLLPWLPLSLALVACSEAERPRPAEPVRVETPLATEEERGERSAELAVVASEREGAEEATTPAAREAAATRFAHVVLSREVSPRRPEDVPDKMRLVADGPLTSASYNTGSALFQGQQVQDGEKWVRHGAWRAWHPDGKPWEEGAYRAGEADGPWRWWYEDGTPQAVGTFAGGRHVGGWTYYHDNGYVVAEGAYEDDRPHGTWRTYHDTGALHSVGRFVLGKREGRWVVHDTEGFLEREASGLYRSGERVGE